MRTELTWFWRRQGGLWSAGWHMACSPACGMKNLVKLSQSPRLQRLLCAMLGMAITAATMVPSALQDDGTELKPSFTLAESDYSTPLITSYQAVQAVLCETTSFRSLAAYDQHTTWYRLGGTESFDAQLTRFAGDLFEVIGAKTVASAPADALPSGLPSVYISERFWKTELGGDAQWLGATLVVHQCAHRIAGVIRAAHPIFADTEIWLPISRTVPHEALGSLRVVGMLEAGVTWGEAAHDLSQAVRRISRANPVLFDSICKIVPVSEKLIMRPAPEETASRRTRSHPLLGTRAVEANVAS